MVSDLDKENVGGSHVKVRTGDPSNLKRATVFLFERLLTVLLSGREVLARSLQCPHRLAVDVSPGDRRAICVRKRERLSDPAAPVRTAFFDTVTCGNWFLNPFVQTGRWERAKSGVG